MHILIQNCTQSYIIGIDECGTGSLAGSVYVCGVKAKPDFDMDGLRDSKKLTKNKKEFLDKTLRELADRDVLTFHIATATAPVLDQKGYSATLHDLYWEVVQVLDTSDADIIIDGVQFKENRYQFTGLRKADDLIPAVSAASVLGKVARDAYMQEQHKLYPHYGWDTNVGYGSKKHFMGIKQHGITHLHRRSYEPIKSMVKELANDSPNHNGREF